MCLCNVSLYIYNSKLCVIALIMVWLCFIIRDGLFSIEVYHICIIKSYNLLHILLIIVGEFIVVHQFLLLTLLQMFS